MTKWMMWLFFMACIFWLSHLKAGAQPEQIVEGDLDYQGLTRTHTLYLPAAAAEGERLPLLIALHGGGGTGPQFMDYSGFNEQAEAQGFIVVYPDGVGQQWHDGRDIANPTVDDVGYIATLMATLQRDYPIDLERVFVTGISNGGFMTMTLACERSELFAGVAAIAAELPERLRESCAPSPLPVLIMNGTDDPLVPYDGGPVKVGNETRGTTLSTDTTVAFWREINGCPDNPDLSLGVDHLPLDGTSVEISAYGACESGASVILYRVDGGGHALPGAGQYLPRRTIGIASREIDGAAEIMDFFAGIANEA
ncbi:MAG: prolyl oligopeptidase family serine peptidase [Anaerolineae bacterium]|nr:prolyl oligopeptidase family serine peptidase [Anaerolineae bacterium]